MRVDRVASRDRHPSLEWGAPVSPACLLRTGRRAKIQSPLRSTISVDAVYLSGMNISDALDKAIAAHAKWKYRLMDAIDSGKSPWRVGDVRTDHACEFGKWLIGLLLSERLSDHAKKVRTLHAEFHGLAADVLEMALAGRKEEARAAMAFGSRFASVSSDLTATIMEWKEAASRGSPE